MYEKTRKKCKATNTENNSQNVLHKMTTVGNVTLVLILKYRTEGKWGYQSSRQKTEYVKTKIVGNYSISLVISLSLLKFAMSKGFKRWNISSLTRCPVLKALYLYDGNNESL